MGKRTKERTAKKKKSQKGKEAGKRRKQGGRTNQKKNRTKNMKVDSNALTIINTLSQILDFPFKRRQLKADLMTEGFQELRVDPTDMFEGTSNQSTSNTNYKPILYYIT